MPVRARSRLADSFTATPVDPNADQCLQQQLSCPPSAAVQPSSYTNTWPIKADSGHAQGQEQLDVVLHMLEGAAQWCDLRQHGALLPPPIASAFHHPPIPPQTPSYQPPQQPRGSEADPVQSHQHQQQQSLLQGAQTSAAARSAKAPSARKRQFAVKTVATALQSMQELAAQLRAAEGQNKQLHGHEHVLRLQLRLAERECQWLQQDAARAPLVRQAQVLAPPSATRPPASGALVSVLQLPPRALWDRSWDERVSTLQTSDLLQLHRQFLQRGALLLPRVEAVACGSASSARASLDELYDNYDWFTQRVMRLAPEPWNDTLNYDADSMQLLPCRPTAQVIRKPHLWSPAALQAIAQVRIYNQGLTAKLRAEQAQLQQQLAGLRCATDHRIDGGADGLELAEVLRLLQANVQRQKAEQFNLVHLMNYAVRPEDMLRVKVALYPLCFNGQTLLPG